jgi:antitoxin Phd
MAGNDAPGAWVESWLSRPRFDKMLATMQTPAAKAGVAAAFDATPAELGAAAVKAARSAELR